ncbi:SDR family NAD(P)-dependent oxidoreductase, partial [Thermodesulfobacteriota bacterium]
CREARSNIESLKSLGSRVKYFAADIRNGNLVDRIAEEIRSEWGDIRILIHGASVISDKYMHAKTAAQFENVFATKVLGFRNLLMATRNDPLTHICCFSSVVARKGNEGQVDYAMANEVLNRVCQFESRRRNGRCLVKALNWGPWDAGMVTPQLKSYFEFKGYLLIPAGEGGRLFVREMEAEEDDQPVEVLLLRGDPEIWLKDRP